MIGKWRTLGWTGAFMLGLAIVAAVYGLIITQPGDLQQRDLYPSLFLERVVEHSVYPLWSPRGTFNIAGTGRLPITLTLVGFAKLFALDGATYARLIILWIVLAAYTSGFFGFSLLSRWRSGGGGGTAHIGALICGVIAAVNPWTIARLEHSWMMAQWAVVPVVVGAFAEGLRTGRKRWILGSALIMAAFGTTQPHYLVITTGMIFLTTLVIAVSGAGKPVRRFADLGLWVLVLLPLSAHFIAPYIAARLLAGSGDPAYTLTDQTLTTISIFQDLPGTLLGTGNFNWQSVLAPSGSDRVVWSIAAWAIALTPAGAILLAGWKRPAITLAAGGYLVAVFIAMSHWDWTAELFQRAVNDVPGFWVFREPDRTTGLVVWSQALSLGMIAASFAAWRGPPPRALGRWALMAYLAAAAAFHTAPATANSLWKSGESNYVPRPLPQDYRRVLQAVDRDSGPNGRILVASSDERAPVWDNTRILRLMEAASLASPSITGDTRSPAPPSPVSGRWFEFFYSLSGVDAVKAARDAGFDHIVVVRDYEAGARAFAAISQTPGVLEIAAGPNIWAGELPGPGSPVIDAAFPVLVTDLASTRRPNEVAVLANHSGATERGHPGASIASALTPEAAIDQSFAELEPSRVKPITDWFGFRGRRGRWIRGGAYADERQSWQTELRRLGLESWSADYDLGIAFAPPAAARDRMTVPIGDMYGQTVWLRVFTSPESDWIDIEWQGDGTRIQARSPESAWRWMKIGVIESETIEIVPGPGLAAVNAIAFAPVGWSPGDRSPSRSFIEATVEYEQLWATKYAASLVSEQGLVFVLLREAYDPLWRANAGGRTIKPVLADGLWNGYIVPAEEGVTQVTFEYAAQRWYDVGIGISSASALTLGALWVVFVARGRKERRAG